MNLEEKLISLITNKAKEILVTNEYESEKNYETNIGNSIASWTGKEIDEDVETERLEIRDTNGEPVEDEKPIGKEILVLEFSFFKKMAFKDMTANEDDVAAYLRKVKSDIYRMIGSNINYFRTELNNFGLVFSRGKWSRDIDTTKYVYGESVIEIKIQYPFKQDWLLNETEY